MRVLVISPQPVFQPRGTPLSVYYRTLITAELGWGVDLLTYGEGTDIDIPGVRIIRIPRFAVLGNVPVGPSMLKLFLDVWMFMKTIQLLIFNRYDLVHAHEEAVFFCVALKPLFRFRYVYDMHSSLPQQLTSFEFTRSKILISIFEWLERRALRSADAIITICQDLYDYAESILNGGLAHELIENTLLEPVRLVEDHTTPTDQVAPDMPSDRRLIVYAGTLEPYQGIDLLLRGFAHVADMTPDVMLVIAGGRPTQIETYRSMSANLGIGDRCLFLGSVSRTAAQEVNRRADVLVSPRIAGGNTPLKIYEQIASGIPLVATRIHSHTQVLDDSVAFLAEPEPASFGDAILRALEDRAAANEKVKGACNLYRERYSREIYVQKMIRLMKPFQPCAE